MRLPNLAFIILSVQTIYSAWPQEIPFQTESSSSFRLGGNVEFSGAIPLLPLVVWAQCRYSPSDSIQRSPTLGELQGRSMVIGSVATATLFGVGTYVGGGSKAMIQTAAVGGAVAGAIGGYYAGLLQNDLMIGTSDLWLGSLISSLEIVGETIESQHMGVSTDSKQYLYLVPRAYGLVQGFLNSQPFLILDAYVFEGEKPEIVALINNPATVVQWKNQSSSKLVLRKTFVNDEKKTPSLTTYQTIIQNPVYADSVWNATVLATMQSPNLL